MTDKIVINQIIKCIPVLLAFGILCSCENDVKKVASLTKKNEPNSRGKNVSLIYSETVGATKDFNNLNTGASKKAISLS